MGGGSVIRLPRRPVGHRAVPPRRKQVKDAKATIQIVWESLNGVLYDLTQGDPADAIETIGDLINLLEEAGANPQSAGE